MSFTSQSVLIEIVRGTTQLTPLAAAVGANKREVVLAVHRLKQRGLVVSAGLGQYAATEAGRAFLTAGREVKGGQDTPRPRTRTRGLRQRAWWVMRARRVVSLPELLSTLADGSERDAGANLAKYVRVLARAGYLAELPQRMAGQSPQSNGYKRYRLARDNGRLAPVLRQRQGAVYDPNTGELFHLAGGEA